ncbi:Protein PTR-23 [Aphelenchoides avenae]|nr:Protein PTR-23 [Aphelenchus avenae]
MARMNQFVGDMEALKGSWGPVGTQYFVRDFITFEKSFEGDLGGEEEPSDEKAPATTSNPAFIYKEEDLPTFIEWPEYSYWSGFIRLDNVTDKLEKFFFTTAYHGKDLSIWTERGKLLNRWREIVDKYSPEFDASVFHEDGVFLDLIENMPTDTWQSVLGTLLCMGAVCFLFLNSFFTVIMASGCVLSICTGILGILSWWGVDLDPITMAAMIISIGCSVDIPAHVSYHYYQAGAGMPDSTSEDKLANCLSSVAFPALQAALSTILCVCSLLFVKLYMSYVFVKTMFLCVVLCNLHGLVFLPAFLILFDSVVGHVKRTAAHARRRKVRTERDHQLEEKRRQASPATSPKEVGKNGNASHNTLEV